MLYGPLLDQKWDVWVIAGSLCCFRINVFWAEVRRGLLWNQWDWGEQEGRHWRYIRATPNVAKKEHFFYKWYVEIFILQYFSNKNLVALLQRVWAWMRNRKGDILFKMIFLCPFFRALVMFKTRSSPPQCLEWNWKIVRFPQSVNLAGSINHPPHFHFLLSSTQFFGKLIATLSCNGR